MAAVNFTTEANGYSIEEVDKLVNFWKDIDEI